MIPKGYALVQFETKLNRCVVWKEQVYFIILFISITQLY